MSKHAQELATRCKVRTASLCWRKSLWLAVLGLFLSSVPAAAAKLLDVRLGVTSADKTRIVIDLDTATDYEFSGDRQGEGLLTVTLKGSTSNMAAEGRSGSGHIATYRQDSKQGDINLTFVFGKAAKINDTFTLTPRGTVKHHRLVVDLETATLDEFITSLPKKYRSIEAVIQANSKLPENGIVKDQVASSTTVQSSKPRSTPKRKAKKVVAAPAWPTIVIDAGHGGGDPGAQGVNGTEEKTVTLAAALKLAEILKAKGRYKIILTRADDARLSTRERYQTALQSKPDLFLSIHADAIDDTNIRGGSVYTLSDEGKERSAEEAKSQKDFQVYDLKMSEVEPSLGGILFDVAQTATLTTSQKFAASLASNLKEVTPMLNNSLRTKDLRVLLAPDVPAVLLELAFISNEEDEANLNSKKWREKTMNTVADSIDHYFDEKARRTNATVAERRQAG